MEEIKVTFKTEIRAEDIMPTAEKVVQVLGTITKIEADNDWDGIAAAIIARAEIERLTGRMVPINVSEAKVVPSDSTTLVVDKTTDGDGFVIDHHKGSIVPKNYLAFSNDGTVPSSSLMYKILPAEGKTPTALLLGATGEIMDGLYARGEKDGCVKEALEKMPYLAGRSAQKNQFFKQEALYPIADILALLPLLGEKEALEIGLRLDAAKIRGVDDILELCDGAQKESVKKYLGFMNNFPYEKFVPSKIGDYDVTVAKEGELEFPMPALAMILREKPGNYLLFKKDGTGMSIRTQEDAFFQEVKAKLGENFKGGGGRAGWYGIQLKEPITYEQFSEKMKGKEKVMT